MVKSIISDINNLKVNINGNVNYTFNSKQNALNILDNVKSVLVPNAKVTREVFSSKIHGVINNIGSRRVDISSKDKIKNKIKSIQSKIVYNKSIDNKLTSYSVNSLEKIKRL